MDVMKIVSLDEPQLEFGDGTHICPKAGIAEHSVYDIRLKARRERILIGGIGTSEGLQNLSTYIGACRDEIPTKSNAKNPRLFAAFCGFNRNLGFHCEFQHEDEITRRIRNTEIEQIVDIGNWNERVTQSVELYYRHVKFLSQNRVVDVIVCVIPNRLYDRIAVEERSLVEEDIDEKENDDSDKLEMNFRRALKARCMHLGKPLQLVRDLSLEFNSKGQQDDATKAWNFCTALYYKANKTVPWRLVPNPNRPSALFVGIGFFRSRDRETVNTSLAQVFDELGNGVILRGTPVEIDKKDRKPYLSNDQAYELLTRALYEYDVAMESSPSRVVIHKTSKFRDPEINGFVGALKESKVGTMDFVTILNTDLRAFRGKMYPPLRGTLLELERERLLLYTRGSVPYFGTYPGMYIPQPLEIRIARCDESPENLCREILALTKMNWNNTQFDGKYPITIQCSRQVGKIMKYLGPEDDEPQISYSFYM
jgi:hypothetical protein